MTIARELATFLVDTAYTDLPARAVDHASMIIASTLASAAGGWQIQSAQIIGALARERGGRPEASVWFDGAAPLPVTSAARVNALMSDAAASDDSDLRNIVHAGTPLTAASLAVAERSQANGEDVLSAIVLGYEAAGRIGESITPGYLQQGFHGGLVAIFASAVAAARLLQATPEQMTHTLALAATSTGGLHASANTSVAREYHAGTATVSGIEAALAAKHGFTAEASILEMPHGFCDVYGHSDGASIVQNLGDSWDIVTDMAIKLVPGGHPHHALAEAAANAARAGDISPGEVQAITLSRPGLTALSGPRHPQTLIDMAHSPAYFLAAGAADREFSWRHASADKIADPVIHQLIDKVRVGAPPTANVERYRQGATVTIETIDGRAVTESVYVPRGAGCRGLDWSMVEEKYRTLMPSAPLAGAEVESSLAVIQAFRNVSQVAELLELLREKP